MFNVGDLVVCVAAFTNDKRSDWFWWPHLPVRGGVYTIRSIGVGDGLRFEEIVNPARQFADGWGEGSFDPDKFRPVRKHSIQIFTDIANGVKQPERENA